MKKQTWAKIDLWLMCLVIGLSCLFTYWKLEMGFTNWWTGMFLLGLLPVLIYDYFRDRKA